jgi:uncharacterized protein
MIKFILLVLGLLLVYWILKGYRRRVDGRGRPPAANAEIMVRCAQCGLHLPRSESVAARDLYFCSADHRQAHDAGRPPLE